MALILSIITHQGTQYSLVLSVLKNKQALFAQVVDDQVQVGKKKGVKTLSPVILDVDFQRSLSKLAYILKPIYKAQKMLESNGATLVKVIP